MRIKKHQLFSILLVFQCVATPSVFAGLFGPSSFSECVEKYVTKTKSNRAALILNHTCRMEFDQKKQSSDWKEYYECVRSNLKNVEQDNAATILTRSCQEKHSKLFYIDSLGRYVPIE